MGIQDHAVYEGGLSGDTREGEGRGGEGRRGQSKNGISGGI